MTDRTEVGTAGAEDSRDALHERAGGRIVEQDAQAVAEVSTDEVDLIAAAESEAERAKTADAPLGRPGKPLNRRSPFFVGMLGAAGVAVTYGLVQLVLAAGEVLTLVGLALFLAAGLDPAVRWLSRWLPRSVAVLVVTVVTLAIVGGFLAAAIPPLVAQTTALINELPAYLKTLQDHNSTV